MTTKIESDTLAAALKRDGGSNRELADRAGISFRAIAEARGGFDPDELAGARKRLGVVSSMTRLATCLGLDPSVILTELKIDASDATVKRQIERTQEASLLRPTDEDPVLKVVRARAKTNNAGPVIGLVNWKPFANDLGGGSSFAKLIARSVLGSLNPEWDKDSNITLEKDFMNAEVRLLSEDSDKPDVLFGLYDLPWRHEGAVAVVPLPGLCVPVGALLCAPKGARKLNWIDVLANKPGEFLPQALVVKGDIGDRLLGAVDYPGGQIRQLEQSDPKTIAAHLETLNKDSRFLFVADGPLVTAVEEHLTSGRITRINDELAPVVRFGFAVAEDAPKFAALLRATISNDLFGRALPHTVWLYLCLLASDQQHQIRFDLADLERQELGLADRFVTVACAFDKIAWLHSAARDKSEIEACFKKLKPNDEPPWV